MGVEDTDDPDKVRDNIRTMVKEFNEQRRGEVQRDNTKRRKVDLTSTSTTEEKPAAFCDISTLRGMSSEDFEAIVREKKKAQNDLKFVLQTLEYVRTLRQKETEEGDVANEEVIDNNATPVQKK